LALSAALEAALDWMSDPPMAPAAPIPAAAIANGI